ncbi:MAG TPA: GH3 auxin-responsive promoter family protein [Kofleriaceae bacterium]|nr:GH3 auxin-responsive promoter family protein [Kofleriaceae bacterium]
MGTFVARATSTKEGFIASLRDARATQARLLTRYLELNRDTVFGREHGFAELRTLDDYRRAVPIRTFAELQPYIDRVVAGERGVLTAMEAVLFLSTTGTTGAPKMIPTTREYMRNSTQTMLAYWATLIEQFPQLAQRDDSIVMLFMAPKPFSTFTPTGVPIHNPTCLPADIKSGFPFARAPWFPPPSELSDADRLYYLVRLAAEHPIVGLACLHPSRLQSLLLLLQQKHEQLIEDIGKTNSARARQLAAAVEGGRLLPRAIWPSLEFVSCWTGGSFELYLPEIRAAFGGRVFPQTSSSSEAGHITLPIDGRETDGPLTIQNNVYEFLPVIGGVRVDGPTKTFDELELGATYELVLTTASGFYRYVCGDVFRVIDFQYGVPCLQFVGRGGVSDMTGEKISDEHVIDALRGALRTCELETRVATCCARWGRPPAYEFYVEPAGTWPEAARAAFEAALDAELRRMNSRYELKRGFGDLGAARARLVPAGLFGRYRDHLIAKGLPPTQLKDKVLHTDGGFLAFVDAALGTSAS